MKAVVTIRNADGSYDEVGMRNRFVTNAYKSENMLIRSVRRITTKACRVEIYPGDRIPLTDAVKPKVVILEAVN